MFLGIINPVIDNNGFYRELTEYVLDKEYFMKKRRCPWS